MPAIGRESVYPNQEIRVVDFPNELWQLYPRPVGLLPWPPVQLRYLSAYLEGVGCKTVVMEAHYVDRDYIDDMALFYARSLRAYPNYCGRIHFFSDGFDQARWLELFAEMNRGKGTAAAEFLRSSYLGFSVVRPLPGSPVGRTVLRTFGPVTPEGLRREFPSVRDYGVHLAGLELRVTGLAFQQQDQGVSACATTAVWSSLQRVAHSEDLALMTPADVTEAASRYVLAGGRPLPSGGLTVQQVCEAVRAAGLAPLLLRADSIDHDRAQLLAYTASGFAPVLAIVPIGGGLGHAVCAAGLKLGDVTPASPDLHYRDSASALRAVYIHDDRLGPYAVADLYPHTVEGVPRTALRIRWPGQDVEAEHALLTALVIPLPAKVRLPVSRMRLLGGIIADALGQRFPELDRILTMSCRYRIGTEYREMAFGFGLSDDGLYALESEVVLSRWVGIVEITGPGGPLIDLLLDATETEANPSVLVLVQRAPLPAGGDPAAEALAEELGARYIR